MSAINASSTSALYLAYRDAGPSPGLIVPAASFLFVAIPGVILNGFVVFTTVRSKVLHAGTANILMALICLFEVLHQSGHAFFFAVVVSGTNFVSLLTADLFMIPALFGINASMMAMFGAALDRLLAVAAEDKHKKLMFSHKVGYLLVHVGASFSMAGLMLYFAFSYGLENAATPTTGCISEILSGPVGTKFFIVSAILNVGCVVCYLLIWLRVRSHKSVTKETNMRLVRSLLVILVISIGGYIINLSVYQVSFALIGNGSANPVLVWQLDFIAGVLLNLGVAANAPILFLNSTDYRNAFKREFCGLAKACGISLSLSTSLHPTAVQRVHPQKTPTVVNGNTRIQDISGKRY